jgi:hypothetical protein
MNSPYSIQCVRTCEELSALRDGWSSLCVESPFMTFHWLHSWWKRMVSKDDLYTVTVRNPAGEIELLAPFYLHHSRTRGKEIRFLGSGRICSDYATFPYRCSKSAKQATEALSRWLMEQNDWDCMNLEGSATTDPLVACFLGSLQDAGHQIVQREEESFWRLELSESFDQFLATRNKKIRQKIRKIERELVPETTIEFCKTHQDVSDSLDNFAAMHVARHQAKAKGTVLTPTRACAPDLPPIFSLRARNGEGDSMTILLNLQNALLPPLWRGGEPMSRWGPSNQH